MINQIFLDKNLLMSMIKGECSTNRPVGTSSYDGISRPLFLTSKRDNPNELDLTENGELIFNVKPGKGNWSMYEATPDYRLYGMRCFDAQMYLTYNTPDCDDTSKLERILEKLSDLYDNIAKGNPDQEYLEELKSRTKTLTEEYIQQAYLLTCGKEIIKFTLPYR